MSKKRQPAPDSVSLDSDSVVAATTASSSSENDERETKQRKRLKQKKQSKTSSKTTGSGSGGDSDPDEEKRKKRRAVKKKKKHHSNEIVSTGAKKKSGKKTRDVDDDASSTAEMQVDVPRHKATKQKKQKKRTRDAGSDSDEVVVEKRKKKKKKKTKTSSEEDEQQQQHQSDDEEEEEAEQHRQPVEEEVAEEEEEEANGDEAVAAVSADEAEEESEEDEEEKTSKSRKKKKKKKSSKKSSGEKKTVTTKRVKKQEGVVDEVLHCIDVLTLATPRGEDMLMMIMVNKTTAIMKMYCVQFDTMTQFMISPLYEHQLTLMRDPVATEALQQSESSLLACFTGGCVYSAIKWHQTTCRLPGTFENASAAAMADAAADTTSETKSTTSTASAAAAAGVATSGAHYQIRLTTAVTNKLSTILHQTFFYHSAMIHNNSIMSGGIYDDDDAPDLNDGGGGGGGTEFSEYDDEQKETTTATTTTGADEDDEEEEDDVAQQLGNQLRRSARDRLLSASDGAGKRTKAAAAAATKPKVAPELRRLNDKLRREMMRMIFRVQSKPTEEENRAMKFEQVFVRWSTEERPMRNLRRWLDGFKSIASMLTEKKMSKSRNHEAYWSFIDAQQPLYQADNQRQLETFIDTLKVDNCNADSISLKRLQEALVTCVPFHVISPLLCKNIVSLPDLFYIYNNIDLYSPNNSIPPPPPLPAAATTAAEEEDAIEKAVPVTDEQLQQQEQPVMYNEFDVGHFTDCELEDICKLLHTIENAFKTAIVDAKALHTQSAALGIEIVKTTVAASARASHHHQTAVARYEDYKRLIQNVQSHLPHFIAVFRCKYQVRDARLSRTIKTMLLRQVVMPNVIHELDQKARTEKTYNRSSVYAITLEQVILTYCRLFGLAYYDSHAYNDWQLQAQEAAAQDDVQLPEETTGGEEEETRTRAHSYKHRLPIVKSILETIRDCETRYANETTVAPVDDDEDDDDEDEDEDNPGSYKKKQRQRQQKKKHGRGSGGSIVKYPQGSDSTLDFTLMDVCQLMALLYHSEVITRANEPWIITFDNARAALRDTTPVVKKIILFTIVIDKTTMTFEQTNHSALFKLVTPYCDKVRVFDDINTLIAPLGHATTAVSLKDAMGHCKFGIVRETPLDIVEMCDARLIRSAAAQYPYNTLVVVPSGSYAPAMLRTHLVLLEQRELLARHQRQPKAGEDAVAFYDDHCVTVDKLIMYGSGSGQPPSPMPPRACVLVPFTHLMSPRDFSCVLNWLTRIDRTSVERVLFTGTVDILACSGGQVFIDALHLIEYNRYVALSWDFERPVDAFATLLDKHWRLLPFKERAPDQLVRFMQTFNRMTTLVCHNLKDLWYCRDFPTLAYHLAHTINRLQHHSVPSTLTHNQPLLPPHQQTYVCSPFKTLTIHLYNRRGKNGRHLQTLRECMTHDLERAHSSATSITVFYVDQSASFDEVQSNSLLCGYSLTEEEVTHQHRHLYVVTLEDVLQMSRNELHILFTMLNNVSIVDNTNTKIHDLVPRQQSNYLQSIAGISGSIRPGGGGGGVPALGQKQRSALATSQRQQQKQYQWVHQPETVLTSIKAYFRRLDKYRTCRYTFESHIHRIGKSAEETMMDAVEEEEEEEEDDARS
jgi:hypothetical protein